MSVYMIGVVYDRSERPIGIRLYDTVAKSNKDCTSDGVVEYLSDPSVHVENLEVTSDGRIQCTNGSLSDYARIYLKRGVLGRSPLVITKKMANNTWQCVNGHGESSEMTIEGIKNYVIGNGLANGRIVNTSYGGDIVPISPNAEFEEEKILTKEESHKKIDRKLRMFRGAEYMVEDGEFRWCNDESTLVKIPEGIVELKVGAFDCLIRAGIKREIIFPKSLRHIGPDALRGLAGVREVKLPVGLLTIGQGAFQASMVEVVYVPPTVTNLAPGALYGIKRVYYYNRAQRAGIERAVSPYTKVVFKPWKGEMK